MRRSATLWIAAGWVLCAVGAGFGQYTAVSPQRLIQKYDFEETNDRGVKLGRGVTRPPGWYAMGRDPQSKDPNFARLPLHDMLSRRPGFPHHNLVRYSPSGGGATPGGGEFSLHLGLDGGSAGAYLEIGALPAVPRSDYLVTAKLKTDKLEYAGARMLAYFIDREGRRIEASVRQTDKRQTDGEWVSIDLKLPGEFEDATYLGLQVELVQPTPDPRSPLGNQAVVLHEVDGHAWFDDIAIWQLPHVEIATQSPVNIIRQMSGPKFDISVRDLIGSRLTTRVTVYDHELREVAREVRPMGWGQPTDWQWTPTLPGFGWYLTELAVIEGLDDGGSAVDMDTVKPVARTYNAVLWLPPGTGAVGADAERFSIVAEGLNDRQLALLPELAKEAGLGKVVLSAWERETSLGALDLRLEKVGHAIRQLNASARRVELSFDPVPEELASLSAINTREAYEVFSADASLWMPYVKPFLIRQGQRIVGWRLGSAEKPSAAFDADLAQTTEALREDFRHWATHPLLIVPWRIDQPRRSDIDQRVGYVVSESESFSTEQLIKQLEVAGWPDIAVNKKELGVCMTLQVQPEPADTVGHGGRAADLAQRMVLAWEYGAVGTALVKPWTDGLERRDAMLPDPLLGVATNVANRLAGYRAVGRLNLEDDRVGIIFEGRDADGDPKVPADGMIVAWRLDATDQRANLNMHLGDRPMVYDVWGNSHTIETHGDAQFVELTDLPVFITGIDAKLALFRSSFNLDEPVIRSTQTPHQRTLRFTNPWPVTISGRYTVTGPEGWTIKPHRQVFSIAPGDTFSLPVGIKFPVNEVAGPKRLTADFDFIAGRSYEAKFAAPLELGLDNVRFEASMSLEPGKTPGTIDAVVTCIITNTGEDDLSINVFASLAGHARRERLVPRLEPGQSVIRQFRIHDAAASLVDNDIRTGVRETNGPAVLNQLLSADAID